LLAGTASAAPVTWNIVSSASNVKLAIPNQVITITSSTPITAGVTSFTVSVRALNPISTATGTNNPGFTGTNSTGWNSGNSQKIDGTLLTNFDPGLGTIQFLNTPGTGLINGIDSGAYQPQSGGLAGTQSADYGTRIYVNNTLLFVLASNFSTDVAIRDVLYSLSSGVLPITGGAVNTAGVAFGTENGSEISFRARDGGGVLGATLAGAIPPGSSDLGPLAGVNTAAGGTVVNTGGNDYKLTVPILIPISIPLDDSGLLVFKATITGTVVATATVPEPATFAMLGIGMAALAPVAVRRFRKRA